MPWAIELMPNSWIEVAVAVVQDSQQRVLITQRSTKTSYAGYWEFPGGKLLPGESPEIGLMRELKEEVALDVQQAHFWGQIEHQYPESSVRLFVYHVTDYMGVAQPCEEQMDLRWVNLEVLPTYSFPAANEQIIFWLKNNLN